MSHKQPVLEKYLRTKISAGACSELRSGCTLTSIEERGDWVYVSYTDIEKRPRTIRSKFMVGADGKTGFTRKNYLEPLGVQLLWAEKYVLESEPVGHSSTEQGTNCMQNKIPRDVGCAQLEDDAAYVRNASLIPALAPRIYAAASLRCLLPDRVSVSVQPAATGCLWTIRAGERAVVAIRVCCGSRRG
jgi:hypothetical protein